MSSKETLEGVGCVLAMWSFCVTTPMWLLLLFVLLQAVDDKLPGWAWVLYFCYLPAHLLSVIFNEFAKHLYRKSKTSEQEAAA